MRGSALPTLLIVAAVIVALGVFVIPAQQITDPNLTKSPASYEDPYVPPSQVKQPYKDENNQLKYATGLCKTNADCFMGGCSSQICSNEPGLITTCIYREDYPDLNVYSCECFQNSCAWVK